MSEKNPTPVENDKGESATVPAPEPTAVVAASDLPDEAVAVRNSRHEKEVTLAVVSPWWTTHFNFGTEDGGTLSIDRTGTVVQRADLPAIFDAATKSGIALTEVSDQT